MSQKAEATYHGADIVTRLRTQAPYSDDGQAMTEAAQEIEKLRASARRRLESGRLEYGLRHASGYVRSTGSKQAALDLKEDRAIHGKRGDWKNHELVVRSVVESVSEWEPSDV